jgi:MFS transporter, SET family, sugar efflux transporter
MPRMRNPPFARFAALASLTGLTTALTSPFLSIFVTKAVGAGPARLALFLLLTSFSAVGLSIICGRLADNGVSGRALLLTGAFAGCGGYALFAVTRSYWPLLLASATLVALSTTLIPQIFTQAREALRRAGHPRAPLVLTNLRMLFSAAWVAGPPAGAAILALAGFGGLFAAVAVVYILIIAASARFPAAPPGTGHPRTPGRAGAGMGAGVAVAAAAYVALQTASALGVLALPLLITRELAASTGVVGLTVGLAAALEIPLMVAFGRFAVGAGCRPLLYVGAAAGAAYYAIVAGAGQVWQVVAAQVLSAVFVSAVMGLGIGFFQDIWPDRTGSATALYTNAVRVSAMIAGPIVGFGQRFGNRPVLLAAAGLCVAGLGLLLATAVLARPTPSGKGTRGGTPAAAAPHKTH